MLFLYHSLAFFSQINLKVSYLVLINLWSLWVSVSSNTTLQQQLLRHNHELTLCHKCGSGEVRKKLQDGILPVSAIYSVSGHAATCHS